jgi:hypothetical protein
MPFLMDTLKSQTRVNLRGKLHRVTPLRHVLDFFPLVNLVNQIGRMIHQPYRCFTRHTGTSSRIRAARAGRFAEAEVLTPLFDIGCHHIENFRFAALQKAAERCECLPIQKRHERGKHNGEEQINRHRGRPTGFLP